MANKITKLNAENIVYSSDRYAFRKLSTGQLEYALRSDGTYRVDGLGTVTDTDIVIPNTYNTMPVVSISDEAFLDCTSLTSVVIGANVKYIGTSAFQGCKSLTSITIPNGVPSIGNYVFCGCSSLTSITIPDSVTSIGYHAFYNCTNLTSVSIPNGIVEVKTGAFPVWRHSSLRYNEYNGGYYLGNSENAYLVLIDANDTTVINEKTRVIGGYAFYGHTSLTNITIPESVVGIGPQAFHDCTALKSVYIPQSVEKIDGNAFYGCTSLTSVTIPESVKYMGHVAFGECTSLTEINFNAVAMEDTKDTSKVFYDSLLNSNGITVNVGKNVTKIPAYLFAPPNSLATEATKYSMITSVNFAEDSVCESIGKYAFYRSGSLTSIEIPDSVTSIGNSAFCGCTSLTSITIPNGVTTIEGDTFYGCTSLTSVVIPKSVSKIEKYAFTNQGALTDVYYTGTKNEWGKIDIPYYAGLSGVTIHYNYTPEGSN